MPAILSFLLILMLSLMPMRLVPGYIQVVLELVYVSISHQLGHKGQRYIGFAMSLFLYILTVNLLGLCPAFFSITSHFSATFGLALIVFVSSLIAGLVFNTKHFLSHFFIPGLPFPLVSVPLVTFIELISYLLRPFTLAVRLCLASMVGHILLDVFAILGSFGGGLSAIFTVPLMIGIGLMELMMSTFQAGVFTLLACNYLKEASE